MIRFDLKDETTLTIEGEKVTSSDPLFERLAKTILAGSLGEFSSRERYPDRELAIALFLSQELNLHKKCEKNFSKKFQYMIMIFV